MNLNHIAKKPFLDAFYRKPQMHHFLRAALYDAGAQLGSNPVGPHGLIRYSAELQRAQNPQISAAIKLVTDVKKYGNHITAMLSYSDLIQLGGITAVEYCGGPSMTFRMGRQDGTEEEASADSTELVVSGNHENAVQVARF